MQKDLTSWERLESRVLSLGMLPYFINKISGFSVEEQVPENLLWDIVEGPWDWKGSVIRNMQVAYGKIFNRRAGYISVELLPDFMNLRRSMSALQNDSEEGRLYKLIVENDSLLSKELKTLAGYTAPRAKRSANPFDRMPIIGPEKPEKPSDSRFESAMTRLQMDGYVVIADFEYLYDRKGDRYGWGVARYTTPEALYGIRVPDYSPNRSYELLFERLRRSLPSADPKLLTRLLL